MTDQTVNNRSGRQPAVLCYGDSNTYGYYPNGMFGERYPKNVRWTGLVEESGFSVINEGICGRRIPTSPAGTDALVERLSGSPAPDVFMIMLGGNDILQDEYTSAEIVAERMDHFLGELERISWFDPAHTLLCAPALLREGAWVSGPGMIEKSAMLGKLYGKVAKKHGCAFADASGWDIEKVFDGVHYTPEGHRAFAENLIPVLRSMTLE